MENPKVFISYAHESQEHADKVLSLSNRLREEGVDCSLDQYVDSPPEGWPMWMDRQIMDAHWVLAVCSESYFNRVMGKEEKGRGLGVKWEGRAIYQHLYDADSSNSKFIPVLFSNSSAGHIPIPLKGATYYWVENKEDYEKLYWRLFGKSRVVKPELGQIRPMPKMESRGLFVTGFIDVDLWNKAKWRGCMYAFDRADKEPPIMGLVFSDESSAIDIFSQWRRRFGDQDRYDELRISIIEGEIPGEVPGYSVHISANVENVMRRADVEGVAISSETFLVVSRIHRMNPDANSPYLAQFKKRFQETKSFTIVPTVIKNGRPEFSMSLGILKHNVSFRNVNDISSQNDPDNVVLQVSHG